MQAAGVAVVADLVAAEPYATTKEGEVGIHQVNRHERSSVPRYNDVMSLFLTCLEIHAKTAPG